MRIVDLIIKKRNGEELNAEEIGVLIRGISNGEIPDYQVAAFLMSVYFRGMNEAELMALTRAMINSGEVFDLSHIPGPKVDKHSTGGVGDKVSLVLAPTVAACGVIVPMVSGRTLGHTGGTLDKLESIPNFRTSLSPNEFYYQLEEIGLALIGQSDKFVPADKRLYAVRDLTGTIESLPLMAASIISKKIASGTEGLVLDVKAGNGAFLQDFEISLELAQMMVNLGNNLGCPTIALITDMNQPLGRAVGNSLEVIESIETMQGNAPPDLLQITCELGAYMLLLGNVSDNLSSARKMILNTINNGKALEKFRQLIEFQGGNAHIVEDFSLLDVSDKIAPLCARKSGYISHINTKLVGVASMILGAGRNRIEDKIDYGVGFRFHKKLADPVGKDETICEIYYRSADTLQKAKKLLQEAVIISDEKTQPPTLIKAQIDETGVKNIRQNDNT